MKTTVIVVHGATNRRKNNSELCASLIEKLQDEGAPVDNYLNFDWSEDLQKEQDDLFSSMYPKKVSWFNPWKKLHRLFRKEIIFGFAVDSITYNYFIGPKYITKLKDTIVREAQKADKVFILGWSLGSLLSYDAICTLDEEVRYKIQLITFGCIIPMNRLHYCEDPEVPWVNFVSEYDVLSYPVSKPFVVNIPFNSRKFILGKTVYAHGAYFKDAEFIKYIINELR